MATVFGGSLIEELMGSSTALRTFSRKRWQNDRRVSARRHGQGALAEVTHASHYVRLRLTYLKAQQYISGMSIEMTNSVPMKDGDHAATHDRVKRCPYCAEIVLDAAVVCKYCASSLEKPSELIVNATWLLCVLETIFLILIAAVSYFVKELSLYILIPSAAVGMLSVAWMSLEKPKGFLLAAILNAWLFIYALIGPGRDSIGAGILVFGVLYILLPIAASLQVKKITIFKNKQQLNGNHGSSKISI